ncbi:MAG: WD40/YVTN/BNR-like repeat-containing protein [Candidatus Korobacteraceae bacterium]|jgi:photosystem II stability/assembly factor-like uncharacterized protein
MSKRTPAGFLFAAVVFVALSAAAAFSQQPVLTPQNSNTTQLLIAVSPVDENVVWAVGTGSVFVVTTDGGNTWQTGVVPTPNAGDVQLRDVQGVSADVAYVLSIGNLPTDFAIYKTEDGGATWTQQFQNSLVGAFYDCFAFWTPTNGIAHSDSVNGVFPDLITTDGMTWQSIANNMPPALPGEASFSSSGTCVATQGTSNAWIATGGSDIARILATTDGGNTWAAYDTPLASGPIAGGFSVAFRDASNGILGGGSLAPGMAVYQAQTATSNDGGQTWQLTNNPPVAYAIFCVSYLSNTTGVGGGQHDGRGRAKHSPTDYTRYAVITADIGGAAWTPDEGTTWYTLPGAIGYWAVAFANPQNGWMVGTNGTILKVSFP